MKLNSNEIKLVGQWFYENGTIHKDDISKRIEWLINNQLEKIGVDQSGWDILYIDPTDNRYWELTYPKSEMQGGGPPTLTLISKEIANKRYSKA